MNSSIFKKKPLSSVSDASRNSSLSQTLTLLDLVSMGLGTIIGVGIFVLTGLYAYSAGPGISLSFAIAGLACIFVALVFTEVASMIPSSGGSYAYSYVALGQFPAWLVGWLIVLQTICISSTVAVGWSSYVSGLLNQVGVNLPLTPINFPAMLITALLTGLLYKGMQESKKLSMWLVFIKLFAILLFVFASVPDIDFATNWTVFMPNGFSAVASAAGSLFLSYIGFEVIANAAEETKNPQRNVPLGIILSVGISAILYLLVAVALTGMVHYTELNNADALSHALKVRGKGWVAALVAAGGISGMTTVILFNIYALARVFMSMSRDKLVPQVLGRVHPVNKTPHYATVIVGGSIALCSGVLEPKFTGDLGALAMMSILLFNLTSCFVMRRSHPTQTRPFRCPYIQIIGTAAFLTCIYLAYYLFKSVYLPYLTWLALGALTYFAYSRKSANGG